MANTVIQLKFSTLTAAPTSLNVAEPAYSYASNTLFIGSPDGTGSIAIGGKFYIDRFDKAYNHANAAFDLANTVANAGADIYARNHANSAFIQANAAFATANSGSIYANGAFAAANSAGIYANGAFAKANNEAGVNINVDKPVYVTSFRVKDWRYQSEEDKIMTTLFKCKYLWGSIEPSQEISELKWFDLDENLLNLIVEEHLELMRDLIKK